MQAHVNKETCTGCGLCTSICEEVFEMDGGVAIVKTDPLPEALMDAVREAAESCPVEAITVDET